MIRRNDDLSPARFWGWLAVVAVLVFVALWFF